MVDSPQQKPLLFFVGMGRWNAVQDPLRLLTPESSALIELLLLILSWVIGQGPPALGALLMSLQHTLAARSRSLVKRRAVYPHLVQSQASTTNFTIGNRGWRQVTLPESDELSKARYNHQMGLCLLLSHCQVSHLLDDEVPAVPWGSRLETLLEQCLKFVGALRHLKLL